MSIKNRRLKILLPLLMLNLILLSKVAQSAAIYDAQTSITLTILAIRSEVPEFTLAGEAEVSFDNTEALENSFADAFGSAQVIADNPDDLGVGDVLFLEAAVQGTAGVSASSTFRTDGSLTVQNNSAEPLAVDFQAEWNYSIAARSTSPDAFAEADIDLFLADLADFFDPFLNIPITATTLMGNESFTDSGTEIGALSVGGRNSAVLAVFSDASGSAAAVPLPNSFSLMALGLGSLLMTKRRWTASGLRRPLL